MKRILITVVALGISLGAGAKDLFKKDLSNAHCKESVWSFNEKGELSSTKDQILWTNDEYENFELTLDFKVTKAGNGGIIIYSKNNDNWIPESIEIQIADYDYWLGKFGPKGTCGAVFGFQGVDKNYTKPLNEWNTLKLVGKFRHVEIVCKLAVYVKSVIGISRNTNVHRAAGVVKSTVKIAINIVAHSFRAPDPFRGFVHTVIPFGYET